MEAIEKYTDETMMPFGKHMGTKLANTPPEYLMWLWDSSEQGKRLSDSKLAKYISENLHGLKLEIEANKQKRYNQYRYERK